MASTAQIPVRNSPLPPQTPSTPVPAPSVTPSKPLTPSPILITPTAKLDAGTPSSATPRQPAPPTTSESDAIHVPSYSRWFSWDDIHECEVRFLPEFFDSRSPSKNPRVYRYYRNFIVKHYRQNPLRKITFTEIRKSLVGDVGSIRRVFDFLDAWGLINYSPPAKPLKWDDKNGIDAGGSEFSNKNYVSTQKEASKRLCNGCKSVCSIACFASEKYDLTLCARCYVCGKHPVGVNTSDFKRVEISESSKKRILTEDALRGGLTVSVNSTTKETEGSKFISQNSGRSEFQSRKREPGSQNSKLVRQGTHGVNCTLECGTQPHCLEPEGLAWSNEDREQLISGSAIGTFPRSEPREMNIDNEESYGSQGQGSRTPGISSARWF